MVEEASRSKRQRGSGPGRAAHYGSLSCPSLMVCLLLPSKVFPHNLSGGIPSFLLTIRSLLAVSWLNHVEIMYHPKILLL